MIVTIETDEWRETEMCSKLSACLSSIQSGKLVIKFLTQVILVDFRGRFKHVFDSLRHICTHKEESRLVGYECEDVRGGDLQPFLPFLDIIKLFNLTADPEKFKQQSPVTTKSNIVEKGRVVVCTRQNRQLSRFSKSSSLPPFLSGVCHYRLCVGLLHHSHTPSPR